MQPQPVTPSPTYRQGRRLFYYAVALIALLLQVIVLFLLNATPEAGTPSLAISGGLLGTGINLLALAAIWFVSVTRNRDVRKKFYRCLAVPFFSPVLSGFFINYINVILNS